ncbi:hypothetical protein LTR91_002138 [Friedmanniomyces endolithicus]|uniref:Protein kinase domain-containing protein n=1 Tax=Friedmanniomyces endolithicus TaxID=329885 RepID=A0AAN6FV83_9PEZI|nr:hypothetical protein LTS09_004696 [Friedmanniomyces endolithicus]KAK0271608.1 hypothetical protein LTR35_013361 [Friedmanniomyces endolithicus]KAK0298153.1 hypothetical protein LTS00_003118 [Friedmanniomyces endolithicus]KAK0313575.1 hypothetical protein LTR01_001832 [Friedmanniomyces endolithicus]KAK0323963.1 hypothetical protein LTR82_005083 [Friedmanniomyces endolithicus]
MMNCILLADGSRVDVGDMIGNGMDGFVIRKGCHVLKIPHLYGSIHPDGKVEPSSENEWYVGRLELEKEVYERLHGVPGIAECIECTSNGILLQYYANGSLREYMAEHEPPSLHRRWNWVLQATDTNARCHEKGVLVFDIATRNFVLTDDLDLRIIDFSNSSLLPLSVDINLAAVDGSTVKVDLLHLSCVIHSIMSWQPFSVDCAMESEWPPIDQIPELKGLEYGRVMHDCWTRMYPGIREMIVELHLFVHRPIRAVD